VSIVAAPLAVSTPAWSGITLGMDAAAGDGSIAVLRDGALVAASQVVMRSATEERFFPAVLETLGSAGAAVSDLRRIVVGGGPGSFTALRVVGSIAKGLAQGRGIPLFAVPSLALVADAATHALAAAEGSRGSATLSRWLVTLDALRGERYAALVERDAEGLVLRVQQLGLLPVSEVAARAAALEATPIGPDEALVAAPHARAVVHCLALVEASGAVDLASWEPFYGRLAEAQVKWETAHGRPLT
jgi:tRNA threonylcarbamoyl adenosine modification protein YeaZ